MARAHEIAIAADARDFDRGIRDGLIEPLGDAEDALKDLERVAKSADLDEEIEKAQKATKKLDRDVDDAQDSMRKLGRTARDAGDDTKSSFGRASENVEEFKNEAAQNFSEVTSSFDGSMDSILDLAQGTLGGLASGISGPLGIALGIAAAGIGLVVNGLVEGEEKAEELREKAREFAIEAVNAGTSTEAWLTGAEQVVARIQELEQLKATDWRWFWQEDPTQLQKWVDGLKDTGRSLDEVEGFLSSSADAQDEYRKSMQRARDAAMEQAEALAEKTAIADGAGQKAIDALEKEVNGYDDILAAIDGEITLRDEAAASADRQRDAGVESAQARMAAEEQAAEAIEAAQESVEQSALSAYDSMRSAAYEKSTADDAAFDTNKWLTYVEETRALADGYKANLATMKLTPEEWENFLALPEDARSNIAASYQTAGEDGKQRIRNALSDTGSTAGSEATVGFNDAFQPEADVTVDVDTSGAAAKLDKVAEKRTAEIEVKTTGKAEAKSALDELARRRNATIDVDVNTSGATAGMANWRRNQEARPITITANIRTGRTQLV